MNSFPRPLRASFWDIAFYSLMVGLGETYIVAFALALGFSEQTSGLIATLPILIGSVLQTFSGMGVRLLQSRRRWVLLCAGMQALALFGFASLGFFRPKLDDFLILMMFFLATCYWTFAMAAAPSWNSWISAIVPDPLRTSFFATRTRIAQLFTVLGLAVTGLWLQAAVSQNHKITVFGFLFAISGCSRIISAFFLSKHPEGPAACPSSGLRGLLHRNGIQWLCERRTIVIILFLFTTHFAVYVSGPYFNAYMLKQLQLDYHHYMMLISSSFVARVLAGGWLHRIAVRYGATSLTHLGSLLIIPTPFLWIFSDSFYYLLALQIFTGFAWGCHELGVTLLLLEKHKHEERARLLTLTTLLNSMAMFLGSSVGYGLLAHETLLSWHYHIVFSVSTILRFIPVIILPWLGDSRIQPFLLLRSVIFPGKRLFRSMKTH